MSRDGQQMQGGRPMRPDRGCVKAEPPLNTSWRSNAVCRQQQQQQQHPTAVESSNWRDRRREAAGNRIRENRAARQLAGRGGEDGMMSVVYRAERHDKAAALERESNQVKLTADDESLNENPNQPQVYADDDQEAIEARDMEHLVASYYEQDMEI